ncbi:dihydrofolate reductase [Halosimplex sp. J119]
MADDADPEIALIAAVAENGVIGADEGIPWHYPEDLQHFKSTTTGHPVILGRRTYRSIADRIGGPLPDRTNVVLTRVGVDAPEGVVVVGGVDEAIAAAESALAGSDRSTVYVAGGASVYEQFLPLADRLVVTEVPEAPDGDTYFPEWDDEEWIEAERREDGELSFVTYERA